jgi:hypothetical protein
MCAQTIAPPKLFGAITENPSLDVMAAGVKLLRERLTTLADLLRSGRVTLEV